MFSAGGRYWWPGDTLDWAAGDQLSVSSILDPSTTASQRAPASPSAYLTDLAPAALLRVIRMSPSSWSRLTTAF